MEKQRDSRKIRNQLIELISKHLDSSGYEVAHVEFITSREKKLRIFIDHQDHSPHTGTPIGIEDCVRVSKTLNTPLDREPLIDEIFRGSYELEISSPGVNRPLWKTKDFQKYTGERARINVFRPLNGEEIENTDYFSQNKKQKNFIGNILGVENEKIKLQIEKHFVAIPLKLIAKAYLDPLFENERR